MKNSTIKRISRDLDDCIAEMARRNKISFTKASSELAKVHSNTLKGRKITRKMEIHF